MKYNCKSAQDAGDLDEEMGPEESLGETNSVLRSLNYKQKSDRSVGSVL